MAGPRGPASSQERQIAADGVLGAAYRLRIGVVTPGWLRVAALTAIVALVVAVVLALVIRA